MKYLEDKNKDHRPKLKPFKLIDDKTHTLLSAKVKAFLIITLIPLGLIFIPIFLGKTIHQDVTGDLTRWFLGFLILVMTICGLILFLFALVGLQSLYYKLVEKLE